MKKMKKIICLVFAVFFALSSFSILAFAKEEGSIELIHDDYGKSYFVAYRENGKLMKAKTGQYIIWALYNYNGESKLTVSPDGSVAKVTQVKSGWYEVKAVLYNTNGDQVVCSCKTDVYTHDSNAIVDLYNYYVGVFYYYFFFIPNYAQDHTVRYTIQK